MSIESIKDILARLERTDQLLAINCPNEKEHQELRAKMVEKYGEDGVCRVEADVIAKREVEYARY